MQLGAYHPKKKASLLTVTYHIPLPYPALGCPALAVTPALQLVLSFHCGIYTHKTLKSS